jgi:hypothetical protein
MSSRSPLARQPSGAGLPWSVPDICLSPPALLGLLLLYVIFKWLLIFSQRTLQSRLYDVAWRNFVMIFRTSHLGGRFLVDLDIIVPSRVVKKCVGSDLGPNTWVNLCSLREHERSMTQDRTVRDLAVGAAPLYTALDGPHAGLGGPRWHIVPSSWTIWTLCPDRAIFSWVTYGAQQHATKIYSMSLTWQNTWPWRRPCIFIPGFTN